MEEWFGSVYELGGCSSDKFGVTRLLRRFPEHVVMEPSCDHTMSISRDACFAVEKYHQGRLVGVVERRNAITLIQEGEETSWRALIFVDVNHTYFGDA